MLFFIANITSNNDVFLHKNSINIQRLTVYMDTLTQIYQVINVNIHIFYTIIQKIYTRFNDIHAKFYLHTNFNIKH